MHGGHEVDGMISPNTKQGRTQNKNGLKKKIEKQEEEDGKKGFSR